MRWDLLKILFVPVLSMLVAQAPAADFSAYAFDPLHTEVRFCWSHLGISRQCAHFTKYEGELLYDEALPENSHLKVTFKTESIETLVPIFNEHMKGDKLFDAEKYPEATFKSTKFARTGEKTGKVSGELTVHGVTKPVTLDITLNFDGIQPMSRKQTLGIAATGSLKRSEFGISAAVPYVSDDVSIEIQTEMYKKD